MDGRSGRTGRNARRIVNDIGDVLATTRALLMAVVIVRVKRFKWPTAPEDIAIRVSI